MGVGGRRQADRESMVPAAKLASKPKLVETKDLFGARFRCHIEIATMELERAEGRNWTRPSHTTQGPTIRCFLGGSEDCPNQSLLLLTTLAENSTRVAA